MTSNEPPEAKAERLAEERAEEEYHERRHREKRRAPKSPAFLPLSKKSAVVTVPLEVPKHYAEFWGELVRSNKIKALNPELSEHLINFIVHDVINDLRYKTTRRNFIEVIREQLAIGECSLLEAQEAIRDIRDQAPEQPLQRD